MAIYIRNRSCPCLRCRTRGLTGGAILVTLGVLFLLEEYGVAPFESTWPVLLIVIGLLSFASHNASTEGHVQPSWMGGGQPPPPITPGQNNPRQGGPEVKS
jgi:hypothetical protein